MSGPAIFAAMCAGGPLDALRSFAGRRVSLNGLIGRIYSLPSSGPTQNRGPIGDRTIMKNLLLLVLSMVAATREATAQEDAQCVRERAAMVETIRAYGRSDASILGQQGLSERVLEAMGQTKRHLFIPELSCSIAYADSPVPIGLGQTISQPRGVDDAVGRGRARSCCARSRYGFGLSGRHPYEPGAKGLHHRDYPAIGRGRRENTQRPRV